MLAASKKNGQYYGCGRVCGKLQTLSWEKPWYRIALLHWTTAQMKLLSILYIVQNKTYVMQVMDTSC